MGRPFGQRASGSQTLQLNHKQEGSQVLDGHVTLDTDSMSHGERHTRAEPDWGAGGLYCSDNRVLRHIPLPGCLLGYSVGITKEATAPSPWRGLRPDVKVLDKS